MICAIAAAGLRPFGHVRAPRQVSIYVREKIVELVNGLQTVKDGVAAIQAHLVLKLLFAMRFVGIPRVSNPAVGLHESSWAQVLVLIPPVGGTRGRAAGTENALIQAVKFLAVFWGLQELAVFRRVVILEVGLDRLVLLVE